MADLKRKHVCSHDGCDFSATHMSDFKRHKSAVHDGLRPYACDHIGCTYTAGQSGTLKKHKLTHIRRYVCDRPDCNEAFTNLRSLDVHVRMHSAVATKGCEERPIPGVPGYTASSHGHVFNAAGKIMAEIIIAADYAQVAVTVDGVSTSYMVHRLVALAFHGHPPDKSYTVDHIDRIKTNNNASNLRWATKAEQAANRTQPDKHPSLWRPVVIMSSAGQVSEFRSVADAVEALGLPKGSNKRALDTVVLLSGGTWWYNDMAREGVTYCPIPSSAISGKEGYQAGDDGSIMEPCGRVAFGHLDSHGYLGWNNHKMHRLVAAAFLPLDATRPFVNHINGVKNDNRLSNLEYVTRSENALHAYATGLAKGREIIGTQASGAETRFPSVSEAARAVDAKLSSLRSHIGRTTAYCGYTWKYVT